MWVMVFRKIALIVVVEYKKLLTTATESVYRKFYSLTSTCSRDVRWGDLYLPVLRN